MKLRILNAAEVRRALPMAAAIAGMKTAFAQLARGEARLPLRTQLSLPEHEGVTLVMPAYLRESEALAVKVVSVFGRNPEQGLPTIHGLALALDSRTGRPQALLEGGILTAIRTGAVSGAATDLLARADATTVAIIGSGVQARTQLEAVCTVREIESVRIFSLDQEEARTFAAEMLGQGPVPNQIVIADSAETAVRGADIVCTATTSSVPVFPGHALAEGTHINAIGAFRTDMQEVDVETIRRSLVVVDEREAALAEAGDLVIPLEARQISESHIHAELGEIVSGRAVGRENPRQITYFKSVGLAIQDAIAAAIALQNAQEEGLGTVVEL